MTIMSVMCRDGELAHLEDRELKGAVLFGDDGDFPLGEDATNYHIYWIARSDLLDQDQSASSSIRISTTNRIRTTLLASSNRRRRYRGTET